MHIRHLEGWELLLLCLTKCNATLSVSLVTVTPIKLLIAMVVNVLFVKCTSLSFLVLILSVFCIKRILNVQFGFD